MNLKYIFFIGLLFFIGSCASEATSDSTVPDKNDQQLYADFFIRFLTTENALKAEAQFKEGLNKTNAIPKEFPDAVQFDGLDMKLKKIKSQLLRYSSEQRKMYQGKHKFGLTNEGEKYEVSIQMSPIKNFDVEQPLRVGDGIDISWEGDPLRKNESIVLLFTDKNNKASSYTINGPTNGNNSKVPAAKSPKLESGNGQLYLVKKQEVVGKNNNLDYKSNVEYYTISKPIVIDL